MKIRKSDYVVVIKGKDKGKKGKVLKVLTDKNRVIVERIRLLKEYIRPNPSKNIQGGIVEKEASISASDVMIYCSNCEQGVRIGIKIIDKNTKIRVCKKCGSNFD
ncbi:MAG: 50S ribosomal protein L24 [Acidobacteriota bacterium]